MVRLNRVVRDLLIVTAIAFMITAAVLLRYYVYPATLVLPLEQNRTYRLEASSAVYLDTTTYELRAGVPVVQTVTLLGDPAAGDDRVAVWTEASSLETEQGERIDYHERRTAFDRRTGMIVDCCEGYVDSDPAAAQRGLAFRLPFGARPQGYPMYEPLVKQEVRLRFDGTETVAGVETYRYTYRVGPVKIEDLPDPVPGRSVGLPSWRRITVARYTEVDRTLWVEPESGLIVKTLLRRHDTLRTPDQVERQTSLQAELVTSEGDVRALAEEALRWRRWAQLVRDVVPALCLGIGGLLAAVLVGLRAARAVRRSAAAQHEQQVPGHELADAG
ncbi:hypothetical protein TBS_24540 [Thermobispora bispora]|uniref:DUF3068 domain-containing protein n=1 Tax=Thermobispora bispora (strain ATCC 19993 / DSM 43833 / CBS 139.67 / JCM 10125 / KCTC 9307 / NBRC 14880 / R51) TaxID=469371 RepID=D6Y6F8_THEBD|nr:DUF3068 domain-containing protein [Thermobispora bispora]MBO2472869.1 DUF3068 domain-containing protein [Actinomycetales bacterium]MDI9580457.1 DUF3068 domain-containing protein [Thermobispora sp.]ADG87530.1 hypothetical protein Tbis_0806 [Thermobispora bispora DSM 43833]MBX6166662.1 DUF3068 domain-containing protein [Thermobispora bispora]QSI47461.1 DUF3068 domain-containing protein [Thermobispora bispora]